MVEITIDLSEYLYEFEDDELVEELDRRGVDFPHKSLDKYDVDKIIELFDSLPRNYINEDLRSKLVYARKYLM